MINKYKILYIKINISQNNFLNYKKNDQIFTWLNFKIFKLYLINTYINKSYILNILKSIKNYIIRNYVKLLKIYLVD